MVTSAYLRGVFHLRRPDAARLPPKPVKSQAPDLDQNPKREDVVLHLERDSLREELAVFVSQRQLTSLRIPLPRHWTMNHRASLDAIAASVHGLTVAIDDDALIASLPNTNDAPEVFVNVPELAAKGRDSFVAHLRHDRMDSAGGHRVHMLWDVAQLQSTNAHAFESVVGGEGGVYALSSSTSGAKVVMFKPTEEEVFVREGLCAGEGAVREEAAYVLDAAMGGFSGVPPTAVARLHMANCKRKKPSGTNNSGWFKLGAVQRFMAPSAGSMEDFGMPHALEKAVQMASVDQVHRIGLLDVRLFNTDRHGGNLLLLGKTAPYKLVPIDHGCILPSWDRLSEARLDWATYPQAQAPFSPAMRQHVAALNASADAHRLRRLGIREECIATLSICTLVLKTATLAGKSLAWIGAYLSRDGCFEAPSRLEEAIARACTACDIPYLWTKNDHGEARFDVTDGILRRRPPNIFYTCLQKAVTLDVTATK
ncbi:hypothetical protein SPRG_07902 [Saprolegnia parasitica CBS 223.65]|uniref:PI3K/PI4K catalytic domain-containing protein n=1 Tax=Saprolegnia parasitica (strain CBS 223.65) TaxID=695850 RepID=A0A067C6T4_SAPPC|nr:hypothetical protein SPRG_07902 [Saprolegnia parasitica CBS 223.65]KDO26499.1 hypothetical protein SPRG_07902 [Saprolegnia parasitica CBS 223.65]|eukprot:XP_012202644.1 hypothetical protein SPRG_07902 [Saprolegnia parasitica CBS 223.65]